MVGAEGDSKTWRWGTASTEVGSGCAVGSSNGVVVDPGCSGGALVGPGSADAELACGSLGVTVSLLDAHAVANSASATSATINLWTCTA